MVTQQSRGDRIAPRIPYLTAVHAAGLRHCWATNISVGGLGITGYPSEIGELIRGDDLEVELSLGSQVVRAVARVAWRSRAQPDGRFSFGVRFHELSTGDRVEISRFLAEHRPRVLVAFATPEERVIVRETLRELDVVFLSEVEQLTGMLLHACASLVVFAHDAALVQRYIIAAHELHADRERMPGDLPLAPITVATDVAQEALGGVLDYVYEVLPVVDTRSLQQAVTRSCERWALQVEVRWASLQLEGVAVAHQQAHNQALGLRLPEPPKHAGHVVRVSTAMQRIYELVRTVAVHDVPVLLTGETGTGKELAAREIHALSRRSSTPFVAQDCGALTETLLESELFGHARGAFTGAIADHPGLFQIADGGTIFLDEIQNTSPTLQAKLLRVVEQGEVRPVGGAKARRVNVRLIVASNIDLRKAVAAGSFRADFFYRLNRFPIELPPLREHPEDILPLASSFMSMICDVVERAVVRIDPRAERALVAYAWPGNIRELRNAIERAILLTPPGEPVRWEVLPTEVRASAARSSDKGALDAQLAAFERQLIAAALERHAGVIRRAARELGVNAVTLARRMRRLGIG
jgi:two-component system, NtrC family, response regulator HupR/HoxA